MEVDTEGRYVCLLCTITTQILALVAIYILAPYLGEALVKIIAFFGCVSWGPGPAYW